MKTIKQIYLFATITRVVTILLGIISFLWAGSYDTSAEIVLSENLDYRYLSFLNIFIQWDSVYFLHIAEHGYIYEQETAFFPFLPYLTYYLSNTVFIPLHSIIGKQYTIVIIGALISNLSFVYAAGYLYKLTRIIYPTQPKLAIFSSIAFCLSLPSMFMSAFYTESLFALLSFMGMYAINQQDYFYASLLWGIASATRSNAIIYAGFFGYELIIKRLKGSIKSLTIGILQTIIYSAIAMSGFLYFQYMIYQQYCQGTNPQPWCSNTIPLVYSYVQKEYWNNGFLSYYEFKQLPNFLLAMPIILLSGFGLWTFASNDWHYWLTLGLSKPKQNNESSSFVNQHATVYMYLWAFLLFYATTCMHVQVIIRFFTSLPPLYWYIGYLLNQGFQSVSTPQQKLISNGILYYFIIYGLVGTILFCPFYHLLEPFVL
ncbi:unnamed protein product [Cunninghamella blakesleeana]